MPPVRLGRPRPLRRAGLRGRVADARGRRVVRIKINMRRTRWRLRRTDVNASASRVADISLRALSLFHTLFVSLFSSFLCVKGFFLPPRFWVLHVQYHPSHTRHSRKARAQEKFLLFFLPNPPPFPPLPFLHVMTIQLKPTTCTYISHRIVFPQSAVVKHISL